MAQSGPCIMCGATNYPMSMGGPHICPPCDAGVPPALTKYRREQAIADTRCEICHGGCPDKEHPVTHRLCDECWHHTVKLPIDTLIEKVHGLEDELRIERFDNGVTIPELQTELESHQRVLCNLKDAVRAYMKMIEDPKTILVSVGGDDPVKVVNNLLDALERKTG